jgi:hypothetical protein
MDFDPRLSRDVSALEHDGVLRRLRQCLVRLLSAGKEPSLAWLGGKWRVAEQLIVEGKRMPENRPGS